MPKTLPYILILLAVIAFIIVFLIYQTNKIEIKQYIIENHKVYNKVDEYKGVKIVFFSDLHIGKLLRKKELKEKLLMLRNLNADLYIFGGDLIGIDTIKYYSIEDVKECFEILKDKEIIAVHGNHEYKKVKLGNDLKIKYFDAMGFKSLVDEEYLSKSGLLIFGKQECIYHSNVSITKQYDLLISHQGDVLEFYDNQIILSGHTHGGQIRIPFSPFYYKPKNGRKYTCGVHTHNNSTLILSNGFGYGGMRLRLFASLDVIVIDYRK